MKITKKEKERKGNEGGGINIEEKPAVASSEPI